MPRIVPAQKVKKIKESTGIDWNLVLDSTSDAVFRRKFCMTKVEFKKLCDTICAKVGAKHFLPCKDCPPNAVLW